MVKLDILSDPICPWCFIGKANLDRAMTENPDHPFVIEWHPFQLNPNMPSDGIDRRTYLEQKFGGQQGAIDVYTQIDLAAKKAGLEINWAGITTTPNTFNAHRLIHWAGIEGRQDAIVAALFRAFFIQGRDIGNVDVLVELSDECKMDPDATRRLLQSDIDNKSILERETKSRDMGVTSVPTFIVGNYAVVPGAQSPEMWAEVIRDYAKEFAAK